MKLALLLILAPLAHAATVPAELATASLPDPLHSRPGAFAVSYLDFDRYPSSATDAQKTEIWRLVASAFTPFDIDVTNADPGPRGNVMWAVIGGPLQGTTAGEAGVGTWTQGTLYKQYGTAFSANVYADGLGNDPATVAFAIIHEDIHLLGQQEHELVGYMVANIDLNQAYFTPQDTAFVGGHTGFAPVPEPPVLIVVACYFLMKRSRRQNSPRPSLSETATTETMETKSCRARRAASSALSAVTCADSSNVSSQPGRSLCPVTLNRIARV